MCKENISIKLRPKIIVEGKIEFKFIIIILQRTFIV